MNNILTYTKDNSKLVVKNKFVLNKDWLSYLIDYQNFKEFIYL